MILRDDHFAWMILDVDRRGYPYRCRIGKNNYPDPESRVWLCKQYEERWRGPRAGATDPKRRTLTRFSLVPGPRHALADKKAPDLVRATPARAAHMLPGAIAARSHGPLEPAAAQAAAHPNLVIPAQAGT